MTWIQIYAFCLFSLALLLSANQHGKPRTGKHTFGGAVFGTLLHLPMIGVVFGWWQP